MCFLINVDCCSYNKSVNVIHAHSLLRGSGKTLHQEQTITSTPICTTRTICVTIYISEDVYCTILFQGVKFSGFRKTKTSVNKRLYYVTALLRCRCQRAQFYVLDC